MMMMMMSVSVDPCSCSVFQCHMTRSHVSPLPPHLHSSPRCHDATQHLPAPSSSSSPSSPLSHDLEVDLSSDWMKHRYQPQVRRQFVGCLLVLWGAGVLTEVVCSSGWRGDVRASSSSSSVRAKVRTHRDGQRSFSGCFFCVNEQNESVQWNLKINSDTREKLQTMIQIWIFYFIY